MTFTVGCNCIKCKLKIVIFLNTQKSVVNNIKLIENILPKCTKKLLTFFRGFSNIFHLFTRILTVNYKCVFLLCSLTVVISQISQLSGSTVHFLTFGPTFCKLTEAGFIDAVFQRFISFF